MLRVTPIYGSRFDAKGASDTPSCTLVEYGNVSVLVNVGWDESCASNTFPELPSHQVLVITDSSLGAIGGLPQYRREHKGIPIYATYPTAKMGQMTLNDYHAAISLDGGAPPFSLDDLDDAFASLKTLKYSQSVSIHDPISGKPALSVTAHRAGYVVGAAFYVFQRLQDETSVVFTSVYHIAKELHLDSSTLLKHGSTPDVLVTHPGGPAMGFLSKLYGGLKPVLMTPVVNVAEKTLIETILAVLRRDGNVLMPIDASGRVLEYILLLSQHWDRHRLAGAYNLCWVAPLAQNTLDYARSQLEWMAAPLGSQFDSQRGHPYQLHNVDICSSLADLDAVMENGNPTCVLSSGASLDCGPARDLLLRWADNPDNAIILPDSSRCTLRAGQKSPQQETSLAIPDEEEDAAVMIGSALQQDASLSEYSTAAQLMMHWCRAKLEEREMDDVVQVDVLVPTRAPLAGNELKDFLVEEEEARQKKIAEEKKRALLEEVELAKGQLRLGEEDITPAVVTSESSAAKNAPTQMAIGRPKKKSRFDSTLFLKFSKPLHLTFDVREEAVGVSLADSTAKQGVGESVGRSGDVLEDDYGIAVNPDHFKDIVTGVDSSKLGSSGRVGEEVARRGLGFGVQGQPVVSSARGGLASRGENEADLEDTPDEMELEALDLSEGKGIIRGRNGRPPIKVTIVPRLLEVLAEIAYIPLEGRVSSRAARQSVRALQPGKVVILGGAAADESTDMAIDEVKLLADSVKSYITNSESVQTPSNGESAELDVGHAAFSVRLVDTPYISPEEMAKREENDDPPLPVEAFEAQLGEYTVSLFDGVATGRKVASDGSIVLAPRPFSKAAQKRQSNIFVSNGEVLLTDLRAALIAEGMKADYSTRPGFAQLVVNGKVIVKKDQESGKIDIEGPLCEDFYKIRSIVCGQFVTL